MLDTVQQQSVQQLITDPLAHDALRLEALRGKHIDLYQDIPPVFARRDAILRQALRGLDQIDGITNDLRYHRYEGTDADRIAAASWLSTLLGPNLDPNRIVVAHGTQIALALILSSILGGEGTMLTEGLTYPAAKGVARLLRLKMRGVEMDEEGIRPDALEAVLKQIDGPKALFCMPNIHNPTGATLRMDRRRAVAQLADKYDLIIVEDDAYGFFTSERLPALSTLVPHRSWHIYTVAKSWSVQLRITFVTGPSIQDVQRVFGPTRRMTHWMASPIPAEIATRLIQTGAARELLIGVQDEVRDRQAIVAKMINGAAASTRPLSPHNWLRLPAQIDRNAFVDAARDAGVLLCIGDAFTGELCPHQNAIRYCIGVPTRPDLARGIETLASLIQSGIPKPH